MPEVTVPLYSYPIGEPIVRIVSPIFESLLFPNVAAKSTLLFLIFNTAKSRYSSFPNTFAISFSLFVKVNFTSF